MGKRIAYMKHKVRSGWTAGREERLAELEAEGREELIPTPSPEEPEQFTRSEKFLLKAIKKKRSKKGGVVSAFGLNRGRIRY